MPATGRGNSVESFQTRFWVKIWALKQKERNAFNKEFLDSRNQCHLGPSLEGRIKVGSEGWLNAACLDTRISNALVYLASGLSTALTPQLLRHLFLAIFLIHTRSLLTFTGNRHRL